VSTPERQSSAGEHGLRVDVRVRSGTELWRRPHINLDRIITTSQRRSDGRGSSAGRVRSIQIVELLSFMDAPPGHWHRVRIPKSMCRTAGRRSSHSTPVRGRD